jgi:hypothetical protein
MNVFHLVSVRSGFLFFLVFLLSLGFAERAGSAAPEDDPSTEALATAQSWLAQIDAGKYEQSYAEGCTAFHNKVSENEWTIVLKSMRPPFGDLVSRKVASHSYRPEGYEGLEGECMIITYNTSFSKNDNVVEIVVLKREQGKWLGAGYNAQPQVVDDNSQPPPQVQQTTTQ